MDFTFCKTFFFFSLATRKCKITYVVHITFLEQVPAKMDCSLFCKVWLEHTRTIHLCIVYGYFPATRTKLSNCNGDHMATKAKNIFYPALYNKKSVWPQLLF